MYQPGDFFLTQIKGPGGLLIRLAQAATGDLSRYTHAGIFLDRGEVIAAQPGGARIDPVEDVLRERPLAICHMPLTDRERENVVAYARALKGRSYSFLDYLSLAVLAFRVRPAWLLRYVRSTGHMICSQLVDTVYSHASGLCLFDDGRFSGDVTPGDLAHVGTTTHVGTGPYRA